jgi:FlaA1/EpsC-like NDP-sugar epimerase
MSEAPRVSSVEPIVANRVTFVISAEVEDIDQALEATKLIAGSTDTSNVNLGSNKSASMTRRVEFADYEAAKVALRELGEVNYEEETVVSYQSMLVETKARISAKETEKERLEALLGKSNTMDVMIRVDSQLSSVITQYEQQVSQLRSIEDTVGRAYLDVNIYEAYKPQEAVKASFKDRLAGGFIGSFNATTEFMENFVIFVSGAIVPLLVIAVIAILIVAIVRLAKKRGSGR